VSEKRRLYLIRHGEVDYFDADGKPVDPRAATLNDKGVAQAGALASLLVGAGVERAFCSGVARARRTAALALPGKTILDDPDFREIKAGRLRDIPPERRHEALACGFDAAAAPDAAFAGGEHFAAFERRVLDALDRALASDWTRAALVAHDAVNRAILAWALGADRSAWAGLEQDPGCLNVVDIEFADGRPVRRFVKLLNFTPLDAAKALSLDTSLERAFRPFL